MKKLLSLVLIFIYMNQFSQSVDNNIRQILNEVNLDSLKHYISVLSGETFTKIKDAKIKISNRYTYNSSKNLAADFIETKLQTNGLEVYNQYFDKNKRVAGRNIYGIKYGKKYPENFVIICAHYDDFSYQGNPSGADDNASGVAAVIEASRLLKNYETNCSIIFALWDKEEVGLFGSHYFANNFEKIDDVLAVINIDMIGYNNDGDDTIEVHTDKVANSIGLAFLTKQIVKNYNLNLSIDIKNPGTTYSDQASFWDQNITSILLIEEYWNNDFNDCLHQDCDKLDKFNFEYYSECTKLAIATLSELTMNKMNKHFSD